MAKTKKIEVPDGFDSFEELHFSWFVSELETAGMIHFAKYHPETLQICAPVTTVWKKALKTKWTNKDKTLLNGLSFTPDWVIYWNPVLLGHFIFYPNDPLRTYTTNPYSSIPFICNKDKDGRYYSYIDIKGQFSGFGNKSNQIFSIIQKVVFQLCGEYVQRIHPYDLFSNTFCPGRFKFTDKTKKERAKAIGTIPIEKYFSKFEIPIQTVLPFNVDEI